jgi:hypothetical protein
MFMPAASRKFHLLPVCCELNKKSERLYRKSHGVSHVKAVLICFIFITNQYI